jgi:hypothetical protein
METYGYIYITTNKINGNRYIHSKDTIQRISEANKGLKWFNDGNRNIKTLKCPNRFTPGMLRKIA